MKRKMTPIIMIILISSILIISGFAFSSQMRVVKYDILTNKVNNNIRIALITDLHSCQYGDKEIELIEAIENQEPDVILLGGDIFDDRLPHDNAIDLLTALSSAYPCYYVTGNHEVWSSEVNALKSMVKNLGIKVLEGTSELIKIDNTEIQITGIDDSSYFKLYSDDSSVITHLESLEFTRDLKRYQILLYHRPQEAENYLSYGYDLMLSGHAHGGQWRIPYLLNGLLAPDQGFFPKYAGGQYTFGTSRLIVSRGLARESTKVPRIFNRPELVIIDLSPVSEKTP